MSNKIKRMNYFNGLLLKEEDLTLDQEYNLRMQRLHNRYLHNWGILTGLEVEEVPSSAKVKVSQGMALNRIYDEKTKTELSQEIFICENHPDNTLDLSSYSTKDHIYITVSYKEELTDVVREKGGENKIHIWERAQIKHSASKPEDQTRDIILARVTLKSDESGNKIIGEISSKDIDEETELRIDAIHNSKMMVDKITIAPKSMQDKEGLPYISGPDDEQSEERKLHIHSPITEFTGSIVSGPINTNGNVDISGALTVSAGSKKALEVNTSGDVDVSNDMTVHGSMSLKSGIDVSGGAVTLDTDQVVVTGNLITINKSDSSNSTSGLEVDRGDEPSAKLVWDENDNTWKIGTDKTVDSEESKMYEIAYGPDWENMRGGSNADKLHIHSQLSLADGSAVLSASEDGDISVQKSLTVSGKLISESGGLEVYRGETLDNAKIAWNEDTKKWEIGVGDELSAIPDGDVWEELTGGTNNADSLHTHRQFHSEDKSKMALEIGSDGDVIIPHNLMVGETLTVNKLLVKEVQTIVKEIEQIVNDSVIVVNKFEDPALKKTEGGLEVYRGEGLPNARIIWDDDVKKWRIGVEGDMADVPYGNDWETLTDGSMADSIHKHGMLFTEDGGTAFSVNENGNVEALGDAEIKGALKVDGGAQINEDLGVGGSITVDGDLIVKGTTTTVKREDLVISNNVIELNKYEGERSDITDGVESGIEIYRGSVNPNARMIWDEKDQKWKLGVGTNLSPIAYGPNWDTLTGGTDADGLHNHGVLCDGDGNTVVSVDADGNVDFEEDVNVKGTLIVDNGADITGGMLVDGSVVVEGDLTVKGTTTTVTKEDLIITNNVIELNKFEGDSSNVKESGIEIYRGESIPKARIMWDEENRRWMIGVGTELEAIAYGSSWDTLTKQTNAGSLHYHSELYNMNGDIQVLSASPSGNVDVHHGLTVGNGLTVTGNLDVRGNAASINTDELKIKSNIITINKYGQDAYSNLVGGIEVYRGSELPGARITWNEEKASWEFGTSNTDPVLFVDKDGNVKASGGMTASKMNIEGSLEASEAVIKGALTVGNGMEVLRGSESKAQVKWDVDRWKIGTVNETVLSVSLSGKVGIGTVNPNEKLDVRGSADISENAVVRMNLDVKKDAEIGGKATIKDTVITGVLTSEDAVVNNDLEVKGSLITKTGMEVIREGLPSAKISWNEDKKKWLFGIDGDEDSMQELMLNDHSHNKLYNNDENIVALSVDNEGNVGIGTTTPLAKLDVQVSTGNTALSVDNEGNVGIGTVEPGSKLDVRGNSSISGSLDVTENLTVGGSLTVNGDVVTVNAQTLEIEDALVRVNKYEPQETPLKINGGLEVFRGGTAHNAQLIWNENSGSWQAGTAISLKNIAYEDHTHRSLSVNETEVLSADDNGNIGIGTETPAEKLDVKGNALVDGSISAASADISGSVGAASAVISGDLSAANADIGGKVSAASAYISGSVGAGSAVISGDMSAANAGISGKVSAASADVSGSVGAGSAVISGDLSAANADISGSLSAASADISGDLSAANTTISGDLSAVNASISGSLSVGKGMEVARTDGSKASIVWSEADGKWQVVVGANPENIAYEDHIHRSLSVNETKVLSADDSGNIGIGTETPAEKLDVKGNALVDGKISAASADISGSVGAASAVISGDLSAVNAGISGKVSAASADISGSVDAGSAVISGDLSAANAGISGSISAASADISGSISAGSAAISGSIGAASADISGDLSAANTTISGDLSTVNASISGSLSVGKGMEVSRTDGSKASIVWNDTDGKWQVEIGNSFYDISLSDHLHDKLYTPDGTDDVVTVDANGNVGIGKAAEAEYKLDVDGQIRASVINQTSSRIYKENISKLSVKTAVELLNKLNPVSYDYKGDNPKKHNIGFIAEDVPDIFTTTDHKSISLMDIIGVLTSVVKKQHNEVTTLKKNMKDLQKQVVSITGA